MVAVALATLMAATAYAQYPSVTGTIGYNYTPLAIEVSPSGNRLATIQGDLLKISRLRSDGFLDSPGSEITEVELPGIMQMAFTPNGHSIICADTTGGIHMVRRSNWSVDSVHTDAGLIPVGIDVMDDSRLAFIHYRDSGRTAVVNYRDAETVNNLEPWSSFFVYPYRGRDICATDDGYRMFRLFARSDGQESSVLEYRSYEHGTRPVVSETVWTSVVPAAAACCVGPRDRSVMVMTRYSGELCIFEQGSSYPHPRVKLDMIDEAVDVDMSADGRFVVVTSASPPGAIILWAEDIREMMSGEREPEDIRFGHVGIFKHLRPRMSCLHPTLNVGYIMCAAGRSTQVIELAVPGTADDGGQ